ncbi:MAG: YfbR-like 5'-deoxynucleotidase [Beijerinckiaceae bacterium]
MARKLPPPRAWQRMLSGRRLDLLDPSPFDIEIEDIAHGLARVARWNGQTHGPYPFSVAQHCLLVEAIAQHSLLELPPRTALAVLLHDAAEYVIGDIISPFKAVLGDAYKGVEARILAAVMLRFGLPAELKGSVRTLTKDADSIAAYYEATLLAGFAADEAERFFGKPCALPAPIRALLEPWTTQEAEKAFSTRFQQLSSASL